MLKGIKEIGEYVSNGGSIDAFIEIPYKGTEPKNYFFIQFDIKNGSPVLRDDIEVEPVREEEEFKLKYLFDAIGGGSGRYGSPTAKVVELEKTFNGKIMSFFKEGNINRFNLSEDEKSFLCTVHEELSKHKGDILKKLKEKIVQLDKKARKKVVLGLLFYDENGNKRYLGDLELFRKLFEKYLDAKLNLIDGTCFLCGKNDKVTISGLSKVMFFYSIDKPGFIVGGFSPNKAYKNFALCRECLNDLQNGFKLLEDKLNFRFYGLRYWLIPNFFLKQEDLKKEVLNILLDESRRNINMKGSIKRITDDEREILDIISDLHDYVSFNFLFYMKKGNGTLIKALLEDVLPSRLHTIFSAKQWIDSLPIIERITVKKQIKYFDFDYIRTFFKGTKGDTKNKEFLSVVESVFKDRPIDKKFFFNFIMMELRKAMANDNFFDLKSKEAFVSFLFLNKLKLFKEEGMDKISDSLFGKFFERFDNSFGTNLSRGLFLLGATVGILENIQMADRKSSSAPIDKKLKNLKLTEKGVLSLLPELEVKFKQYGSFGKDKQIILKEASNYLLSSGRNWKMSIGEINFYIAAGLLYRNEIKDIAEQKTNGGD